MEYLLCRLDSGRGDNEGLADSRLDVGHGLPSGQADGTSQQPEGWFLAGQQRDGRPQNAALQARLQGQS